MMCIRTAFNWLVSLPVNSIDTWEWLEQRFHGYFYNGETELRLSHLVVVKHMSNETVVDYMQRFRDTRNKCCGLTIREKDLAELAFAELSVALKDKMAGHDFVDMNQVLQRAMGYESRAKEHKTFGWFKEVTSKEKMSANLVEEGLASNEDAKV
jgi:hypothetical protein